RRRRRRGRAAAGRPARGRARWGARAGLPRRVPPARGRRAHPARSPAPAPPGPARPRPEQRRTAPGRLAVRRLNAYVASVIAAGLAAVALVATGDPLAGFHHDAPLLITLVVGTMVGEMLPIQVVLRRAQGEIVLSTTFAFATLLAFGPDTACIALAGASVVADCLSRKAPAKIAFNA